MTEPAPGAPLTRGASLGLFAWFGISAPFPERMKMIRDAGFEAVSLWWEHDDEARRRLRRLAPDVIRNAGLLLDNIHVPYNRACDLWSDDVDKRESAVALHRSWVEDCARHDVGIMVMHPGRGKDMRPNRHGPDSVARILDAAERHGVTIAIENGRADASLEVLFEQFHTPTLAFCYDIGHDIVFNDSPFEVLRLWGDRLVALHLHDNDGVLDRHWLPGQGVIDFDTFLAAVDWAAYKGSFHLETIAEDDHEDPEFFLQRAYESLTALRARPARALDPGDTAQGHGQRRHPPSNWREAPGDVPDSLQILR